jgi:hypothetical protein
LSKDVVFSENIPVLVLFYHVLLHKLAIFHFQSVEIWSIILNMSKMDSYRTFARLKNTEVTIWGLS